MKKQILLQILLILSLGSAFAQMDQTVTITKQNGEKINLVTTLRYYEGRYIFPDDNKDFIRGEVDGKKVKINKSEIKEISQGYGPKYIVVEKKSSSGSVYYIGFYITQGKINLFKTYSYGHQSYGTSTSINKVATVTYFNVLEDKINLFSKNSEFKKMAKECPEFKSYTDKTKIRKDEEIEEAVKFYNKSCD